MISCYLYTRLGQGLKHTIDQSILIDKIISNVITNIYYDVCFDSWNLRFLIILLNIIYRYVLGISLEKTISNICKRVIEWSSVQEFRLLLIPRLSSIIWRHNYSKNCPIRSQEIEFTRKILWRFAKTNVCTQTRFKK